MPSARRSRRTYKRLRPGARHTAWLYAEAIGLVIRKGATVGDHPVNAAPSVRVETVDLSGNRAGQIGIGACWAATETEVVFGFTSAAEAGVLLPEVSTEALSRVSLAVQRNAEVP